MTNEFEMQNKQANIIISNTVKAAYEQVMSGTVKTQAKQNKGLSI